MKNKKNNKDPITTLCCIVGAIIGYAITYAILYYTIPR